MDQQSKLSHSHPRPQNSTSQTKSPTPHTVPAPPPKADSSTTPSPPETHSDRVASYSAWPHAHPTVSEMAEAGFHQTNDPEHRDWRDLVQCSQCRISLRCWKVDSDPLDEHLRRSPQCVYIRAHLRTLQQRQLKDLASECRPSPLDSAIMEPISPPDTSTATPLTPIEAAVAAVKVSLSSLLGSLPPRHVLSSPCDQEPKAALLTPIEAAMAAVEVSLSNQSGSLPPQHVLISQCDQEPKTTLATADASPQSMEEVVLEVEDWVELRLDGGDEDDWIQV